MAFYLKNINKPLMSFKQRSDTIGFLFPSDRLDWKQGRKGSRETS